MGALVHTKTWSKTRFQVVYGDGPTQQVGGLVVEMQYRQLLYDLMLTLTTSPGSWTVAQSCGYTGGSWAANTSNNWTSAESVMFSDGTNYSWMVLQQNGIRNGFQMLWACEALVGAGSNGWKFYFSPSGSFTGGTITTRPTAVDEYSIFPATDFWSSTSSLLRSMNVLQSSDGECTRIFYAEDSNIRYAFMVDKLYASTMMPNPPFENQCLTGFFQRAGDTDALLFEDAEATAVQQYKMVRCSGYTGRWFGCCEGHGGLTLPTASYLNVMDPDGNYAVAPVYGVGATAGVIGVFGRFQDLYAAPSVIPGGDYMPADGSMLWVKQGKLIHPNDGTIFVP